MESHFLFRRFPFFFLASNFSAEVGRQEVSSRCDATPTVLRGKRGGETKIRKKWGKLSECHFLLSFRAKWLLRPPGEGGGDEKSHNLFRLLSFLLDCPGWFQVFFCFLSVQTKGGHAAYQQQLETEADDRPLPNKHDLRLFLYFLTWSIRSRLPRGE